MSLVSRNGEKHSLKVGAVGKYPVNRPKLPCAGEGLDSVECLEVTWLWGGNTSHKHSTLTSSSTCGCLLQFLQICVLFHCAGEVFGLIARMQSGSVWHTEPGKQLFYHIELYFMSESAMPSVLEHRFMLCL